MTLQPSRGSSSSCTTQTSAATSRIITSPLEEWTTFLDSLENDLRDATTNKPADDLVILSCGCLTSEKLYSYKKCVNCGSGNVTVVTKDDTNPLRSILKKINDQRTKLGVKLLNGEMTSMINTSTNNNSNDDSTKKPTTATTNESNIDFDLMNPQDEERDQQVSYGLIELFRSTAQSSISPGWIHNSSTPGSATPTLEKPSFSTSSASASIRSQPSSTSPAPSTTSSKPATPVPPPPQVPAYTNKLVTHTVNQLTGPQYAGAPLPLVPSYMTPDAEKRESNYNKCFPVYRKQFQHYTQPRTLWQRSKKMVFSTCISPDASTFAIASATKFQIFAIASDYNDAPVLISEPECGQWGDNPMLSMSNNFVTVAGRNGVIRIFDFEGRVVFEQDLKMEIHCVAISPMDSMLAFGIYGRNPLSSDNETCPMIALHVLTPQYSQQQSSYTLSTEKKAISIVIPYRDSLSYLKFSTDEAFITCATLAESRFMVISLSNRREPRLVMKSSRRVDPDEEFEGITSVNFFPPSSNRHQYMCVTSSVFTSAPPIILDTKIATASSTASSSSQVSQPSLLMRVDKVGSRIHNSAVSPRADAMAFLDKSGVVYVMHAPGLLSDQRCITVATEVASASHMSNAASMQFTPSGQVLVIVDRKGDLHIQDYGAGTPQQAGVGKCRLLG